MRDAVARLRTSGSEPARLHLRYLRLQSGAIVARNVVGKWVFSFPAIQSYQTPP
ncbi:hypothetical protein Tco_0442284, partial [Tanacetum coccineum]